MIPDDYESSSRLLTVNFTSRPYAEEWIVLRKSNRILGSSHARVQMPGFKAFPNSGSGNKKSYKQEREQGIKEGSGSH